MASQVGEAVIKLTFDGKNVNAQLSKVENEVEKTGKKTGSAWGSAWAVAAGNLIAKGVSKVASMVTNTMGNAISRLDTLNNFPRVMESLGYSADEANTSVTKISDALDGLPTSLDAMVADTQKLAASLGNLAQGEVNATSLGLGLNDMLLAGGKGTEAVSRAMEQYNQMLGRGKVDMQSWVSLVNAAPGQMDQLAKSILGAEAGQAQLYQAMQDGTVSFDQLNAAIVQLDQEGGQGFASFYDQAVAATGGVATQIENIGNTMNKILASALDGNLKDMDKYIKQLAERVGKVAPTLIRGFAGAFSALMQALPGIITAIMPAAVQGMVTLFQGMVEAIPMFVEMLVDATPMIMDGMVQMLNGLVQALPIIIPKLITAITNLVTALAHQLTRPDFLTAVLQAATTLFLEVVKAIPQILTALIGALPQILDNIIKWLTDPNTIGQLMNAAVQLFMALVMAVPQILGALLGAFGTLVGNLWNGITAMFGQFAANFGNFIGGIFKGAINGVLSFIENMINGPIDIINGFIGAINDTFGGIGVHIDTIGRVSLPRLAEGGVATGASPALIGEAGTEVVLPLEQNTDNWSGLLASALTDKMEEQGGVTGGTVNVYMTNEINSELDAQDIGRVMIQSIRRAA